LAHDVAPEKRETSFSSSAAGSRTDYAYSPIAAGQQGEETMTFNGIRRSFVAANQIAIQDPRIGVKLNSAGKKSSAAEIRSRRARGED